MGLVGGAIRFGYTRDGGAYAVGLYYGGETCTEYIRPGEDVEQALIESVECMIGSPEAQPLAPRRPKEAQGTLPGL